MKRLALLTSGGDAPGMNAAIRSVVRTALARGCRVIGVRRGFLGLVRGEMDEMTSRSVADIVQRGGTMLRTARCQEFMRPEGQQKALAHLREWGVDGVVVIGGNGSLRGALALHEKGMPTVGIPATIDNDIAFTKATIGFDTAVNTAVESINKIRDTATSHERTYVVEVMGRDAGHLALHAGAAGGAECILVPEFPVDLKTVAERVRRSEALGKAHSIIIVAEGFGRGLLDDGEGGAGESVGFRVGRFIREHTPFDVRVTVLGHLQRGGNPTAADRVAAAILGEGAVSALLDGESGVMIGLGDEQAHRVPLRTALETPRPLNRQLLETADLLASL